MIQKLNIMRKKARNKSKKVNDKVIGISKNTSVKKDGSSNHFELNTLENYGASLYIETDDFKKIVEDIEVMLSEIRSIQKEADINIKEALNQSRNKNTQYYDAAMQFANNDEQYIKATIQFNEAAIQLNEVAIHFNDAVIHFIEAVFQLMVVDIQFKVKDIQLKEVDIEHKAAARQSEEVVINIKEADIQFNVADKWCNSQVKVIESLLRNNMLKVLKDSIQDYFHRNIINNESDINNPEIKIGLDDISRLMEDYSELEDPEIYSTFINSIHPECLDIIQTFKSVQSNKNHLK